MGVVKKLYGAFRRVIKNSRAMERRSDGERLKEYVAGLSIIKLHFGCGPRVLKGWVNIDLAFEPYANYLQYYGDEFYSEEIRGNEEDFFALDITKERLPLDDNSVDVVFHEDFIEHLDQRSQMVFLAEMHRVLKPGGVHRVNTPDLEASMREHSDFTLGGRGVFVGEWDRHGHKNVLTPSMLSEMAKIVGYREVAINGRDMSAAAEILPREYRPDPNDRDESGNIFADLIK